MLKKKAFQHCLILNRNKEEIMGKKNDKVNFEDMDKSVLIETIQLNRERAFKVIFVYSIYNNIFV
jgi:hypothetical protein